MVSVGLLFCKPSVCRNCKRWIVDHSNQEKIECKNQLKKSRHGLNKNQQLLILKNQSFRCNICLEPLEPSLYDLDHIDGNSNNGDFSNFQALCLNCHRLKHKFNLN